MAGPMIGGSASNERVNNKVTAVTFNFQITDANPPTVFAVNAPTVGGEAGLILADGAGAIVTDATFDVTVTGANPIIGLEFKDTTITASAELVGASGYVVAGGAGGAGAAAAPGTQVWAGPADLLKAHAGLGMALYLHLGSANGEAGKIDQGATVVKFFVTVYYIVD